MWPGGHPDLMLYQNAVSDMEQKKSLTVSKLFPIPIRGIVSSQSSQARESFFPPFLCGGKGEGRGKEGGDLVERLGVRK